jgi:NAD(P)H-hydrate repair Nnr-like enzyme with NAD(P)H-hydrate dehydratase domain
LAAALSAAADLQAVVVLKGPGTVIAAPTGTAYVDTEGTSDLGTAGSGDVLSGVIGGLLAGAWADGRRDPESCVEATAAAVWLHGAAGRIAAQGAPITATDIADAVPSAVMAARFGSRA